VWSWPITCGCGCVGVCLARGWSLMLALTQGSNILRGYSKLAGWPSQTHWMPPLTLELPVSAVVGAPHRHPALLQCPG